METVLIANDHLMARVTPFGATLTDLRLKNWQHPLILGFDRIEDYSDTDHYAGAVIGRHANRIGHGRARLSGQVLDLPRNGGGHHLHGGQTGSARQNWDVVETTPTSLTLRHDSPHGHEGYPGNCAMVARYSLGDAETLVLDFEATSDAETLVNFCHHPYFDFSGTGDIASHYLKIVADTYLPASEDLLPTGEIAPVAGTNFDFRSCRAIGTDRPVPGFNNNFCLAASVRHKPELAARLALPGGPSMDLWTTQTGLQLYDGYKLMAGQQGLDGRIYGPGSGLCLEAQNWPDSPSHSHFPSALLQPGETYRQSTEYRFSLSE